jgi:type VI secretion system secreted protein VgrG
MEGTEQLGRTFFFTVHLLSLDPDIVLANLIGQTVSVSIDLSPQSAAPRYFHAHVIHFQREGKLGNYYAYSAHLAPWLWLLSYAADCRIFQNVSIPDIVMAVFRQHAIADFDDSRLTGTYAKLDYVTQYDETDLAFVSRLMEDAGIYYYFEHHKDKHTLVLADSYSAHHKATGYEEIPLLETTVRGGRTTDYLDRWSRWNELRPGAVVLTDYDFEKPRVPLEAQRVAPNPHAKADFEVYQYPGNYDERSIGEDICRRRLDEFNANYEKMGGSGNVRGLGVGNLFDLVVPPPGASQHEYLVDFASYDLRVGGYETKASANADNVFFVHFTVLDSKRQFRPERRFKPKKMPGPQTATVVGKSGEEIWTDKYGRVKVQFHWDRKGKNDENSSCWIRVAQVWAGKQWGAMHIPRIGQEVIVEYLDGDPDRPLITGRLYNADNMPPYDLPANQTQSGIKSRSSKGGTANNFNEIRFEDLKGKEELHIQAERDESTLVKRNQSTSVGADRSVSVGGNHTVSVTGTQTTTITKKETQTYNAEREMKVALTNLDEITGAHTGKYHAGRTETVEKGDTLTVVGSDKTVTVHGEYNTLADTQYKVVEGEANILFMKDKEIIVNNGKCEISLSAGEATVLAPDSLTLKCGDASITLKKDGSIEINGKEKVNLSGGGSTVGLERAGATMKGKKVGVTGEAVTEIMGALIKIN